MVYYKNIARTIGQNLSRDFGLSASNRHERAVINFNLCFLIGLNLTSENGQVHNKWKPLNI